MILPSIRANSPTLAPAVVGPPPTKEDHRKMKAHLKRGT
jgi:hypothetical protein